MRRWLSLLPFIICAFSFGQSITFPGPGTPVSAGGGITLVNKTVNESDSSVSSLACPATNHSSGNLIAVFVRIGTISGGALISGIADTAGNTYVNLGQYSDGSDHSSQWWYSKNVTGNASNIVTVTFTTPAGFQAVHCFQVAGLSVSTPSDVDIGAAFTSNTPTSGTFSTATASEIVLCGTTYNATNVTATAGGTYTLQQQDASKVSAVESNIFSNTQSSVTCSMSLNSTPTGIISVASFR